MNGEQLLEKRLTLALTQKEMTERMKIPLSTYTRLEQNKDLDIPSRYEPGIELIEIQRRKELTREELEKQSKALRYSYEKRIETKEKRKKKNSTTAPKRKKAAAKKK